MPTFYVIKESGPVDSLRGADGRGLAAMVAKHASTSTLSLPVEAEEAKTAGNAAFAKGEYYKAIEHYSRAIELAQESAVLYGNRALAYIKLAKSPDVPKEERQKLRPKALEDAIRATQKDERWGKGWVRMAEATLLAIDEEGSAGVAERLRQEGLREGLAGAEEALHNAVRLSEGKVKFGRVWHLQSSDRCLTRRRRGAKDVEGRSDSIASVVVARRMELKKNGRCIHLDTYSCFPSIKTSMSVPPELRYQSHDSCAVIVVRRPDQYLGGYVADEW